jgi:tetratricopeptide (TPR) repeat protein/tRNA A-37 threonylcarbamoyl transferase component Bud32
VSLTDRDDRTLPPGLAARLDPLCDRFESEWLAGGRPRLEDYLPLIEEPDRSALLWELLEVELHYRRRGGEQPTEEEYRGRLPGYDHLIDAASLKLKRPSAPFDSTLGEVQTPPEQPRSAGNDGPSLPRTERYALDGEIGRGGMGVVLRGRDPKLGREVALKVLREQYADNEEAKQRFLEEAQIAGQLQHPGVVPIYELDHFEDGRPFFAMKLVKGRTLAALLKERPDPTHDRPRFLQIFEQTCQALAYAHSKKVIHRDLKPANVMVGAFGEVQVMDWGLAKVLGTESESPPADLDNPGSCLRLTPPGLSATDTQPGSIRGTPAYMPPEQALGEVDRLDRRSDVFGLGAILCEILTGQPPYGLADWDSALRRAIRADLTDALARLESCGADSELTALTKRCLAAEPNDRPADAGAVAEAVAAYLAGVQERLRGAEVERATAQARTEEAKATAAAERRARRRTAALAATVLLTLLILGGGGWWLKSERDARIAAEERRHLLDAEADRRAKAQREASRSLVKRIFAASDPLGLGGLGFREGGENPKKLSAFDLLNRTRDRIKAEFQGDPAARAVMLDAVGDVYRSLGYYREAKPLLEEAVDLCQRHIGPDELETADSLHHLGWYYHDLGFYDEARPLYENALAIRRARLGPDDLQVAASLFHLGWLLGDDKDHAAGVERLREAIAIRRKKLGDADRETAISLAGLAALFVDAQRPQDAIKPLEEALSILSRDENSEASLGVWMAFLQGVVLKQSGFPRQSVGRFREAIELAKPYVGDDHPYVAFILFEQADALEKLGNVEEAERMYRDCLRIAENSVGLHHPKVIAPMIRLMQLLGSQKRIEDARQLLNRFVAIRRKEYKNGHKLTAEALYLRGLCEVRFGEIRLGLPYLREAVQIIDGNGKPPPPWFPTALIALGRASWLAEKAKDAEALLRRGLEFSRKQTPSFPGDTALALTTLADLLLEDHKLTEAEPLLAEAESICRQIKDRPDRLLDVLIVAERLYLLQGDKEKAKAASKEAASLREAALRSSR